MIIIKQEYGSKSLLGAEVFKGNRNNLLQIGVEPCAPIPIYSFMDSPTLNRFGIVDTEIIVKFLADSRRYLTR